MKKILFCNKYDRLGASSRLRTLQFLPYLKSSYICQVNSLFSNKYVANIYSKTKQNKLSIFLSYIKRFLFLITTDANVVVIEKELFPYLPYCIEKIFLWNKKYIIDIDDAVFHNYDLSYNPLVKFFLAKKFGKLFANSFAVFAGSPYLVEYAERYGVRALYYPTVIDLTKYDAVTTPVNKVSDVITIGWIGTNGTAGYLDEVIECLDFVASQPHCRIEFLIIGSDRKFNVNHLSIKYAVWSEEREIELIKGIDIGIMPLRDTLWEKGKCAYKLIQYMACQKPVVASAIGANNIVVDDSCGFLCHNSEQWKTALMYLVQNRDILFRYGANGYKKVQNIYCVEKNLQKFKSIIDEV